MIIDASIVVKWLVEEEDSAQAATLAGRGDLHAPSTLTVEIGHVLTKLARARTISRDEARVAWDDLGGMPLVLLPADRLLRPAFDLSLRLNASYHDCVYLALALAMDDVLVTADGRFVRSVRSARDLERQVLTLVEATA